jgi:23S rRNA pseudouridine1911/1915/1917 synthase
MRVSSRVPAPYKDWPLIDYLASRFSYVSADTWQRRIEDGHVFRNGEVANTASTVRQGDRIACDIPDFDAPDVNFNYSVVHRDPWLLGINKPPNLRVHAQGKWIQANLIYHLRFRHQPRYPRSHLVNRLDANTSGIVLLALDKQTLGRMGHAFRDGEVVKEYMAIVHGVPKPAAGLIELPIGQHSSSLVPVRQSTAHARSLRQAATHYQVVRQWGEAYASLRLTPITGRTHQLRVHMAAIGHPLVGDALYTLSDDQFLAYCQGQFDPKMLLGRQALHCLETRFCHPQTGDPCLVTAPLAEDMLALLARLDTAMIQMDGLPSSLLNRPQPIIECNESTTNPDH